MTIEVKVHPLGELLSKALFGIEDYATLYIDPDVKKTSVRRTKNRAIKEACEFYDSKIAELKKEVEK